jgi:hypothetical protein
MRAVLVFLLVLISTPVNATTTFWQLDFNIWFTGTEQTLTIVSYPPAVDTNTTDTLSGFAHVSAFVEAMEPGTQGALFSNPGDCSFLPGYSECEYIGGYQYDGSSISVTGFSVGGIRYPPGCWRDSCTGPGGVPLFFPQSYSTFSSNLFLGQLTSAEVVSGDGSPPLPEPATWAMMLLGFGVTGFTIRRHRKATRLLRAS